MAVRIRWGLDTESTKGNSRPSGPAQAVVVEKAAVVVRPHAGDEKKFLEKNPRSTFGELETSS